MSSKAHYRVNVHLEARLAELSEKDSARIRSIFERFKIKFVQDLDDWLLTHLHEYLRPEKFPDSKEKRELAREAQQLLTRKPFEPETFAHRALSDWNIWVLAWWFGSRKGLEEAVNAGTNNSLESRYAAWLFGLIPLEELTRPRYSGIDTRADRFKLRKKRKRG